jgi:hypothetical protein
VFSIGGFGIGGFGYHDAELCGAAGQELKVVAEILLVEAGRAAHRLVYGLAAERERLPRASPPPSRMDG